MKTVLAILVITVILGSPIWTSLLTAVVARRSLFGASIACCLQLLIAYLVWWFYWGGGIGGEAHLPDTWQVAFLAALAPIAVTVIIRMRAHRNGTKR